ncbi:MAG: ABC transporter [Citromicrobium sp.]|nr:ABC transporter [Citromicrobium sp.]
MPGGLAALLDDVSIIARSAAASVDDVAAAASKAGSKTAGVVIDDAAVTPGYVTGFSPARELPIIAKIAVGSVKNKLLILLPGALLLSQFLPQAIVFILMLGGCYLSYEGAEKIIEKLGGKHHGETLEDPIEDKVAFEKERVSGAIRTDLILSAEIMAITLNEVAAETFITRAGVLAVVGLAVTAAIYGAVALIVKLDDIGLHLMEKPDDTAKKIGKVMLNAMPHILTVLSVVGTAAMLWVGGGIILHGTHELGFHTLYDASHGLEYAVESTTGALGGVLGWATYAAVSALLGLVLGAVIVFVLHNLLGLGHGKDEGAQGDAH